jgi:hypothetical protein
MTEAKQNLYKLAGIFKCTHDVHRHFNSELSPYYILSEKGCFPYGCVYFNWKCRLLAKKRTCFRGFKYVGRKCFNCRYFYEEKLHQYPEYVNTQEEYSDFKDKYDDFELWVNELLHKRVHVEGEIDDVFPALSLRLSGSYHYLEAKGFLIRFFQGYFDNYLFSDIFYLSVSAISQNKLQFRRGDTIEFDASLRMDRGRFKFFKPGKIQFYNRGNDQALKQADVLVSIKNYTIQKDQPQKCLHCEFGALVDITNAGNGPSRAVVCRKGIADHNTCILNLNSLDLKKNDTCVNADWQVKKCHHVI